MQEACGRHGSIPGSERFPGVGNGIPLQYSCLKNPMDIGARWAEVHGVTKQSDTIEQLNNNIFYRLTGNKMGFAGSSAGKESACNAGGSSLILLWEVPLEKDRLPTPVFLGFPGASDG